MPKSFITSSKTSLSDTDEYTAFCRRAAEEKAVFTAFKQNSIYRQILEHLTEEEGKAYLSVVRKAYPWLLPYFSAFQKNDVLGGPLRFRYPEGMFSPTTLRYVKVLGDLVSLFGPLDGMNVVEIGGGYGGQCFICSCVFPPKRYTIVDLKNVLQLATKYLVRLCVTNVVYKTPTEDRGGSIDLCISNYAFSECTKAVQDWYIEHILKRSRRGYITYNYQPSQTIIPYTKEEVVRIVSRLHKMTVLDEDPQTGNGNIVITWNDAGLQKKGASQKDKGQRAGS